MIKIERYGLFIDLKYKIFKNIVLKISIIDGTSF